jgi:hypothetical protein
MKHADAFEHDDAAYVMGMLSGDERAGFEAHLTTCDACSERVRQLTPMAGVLAGINAGDLLAVEAGLDPQGPAHEPMPETLLPGLLRRAGVHQRRQRRLTTGISGLAVASLIALAVVVWPSGGGSSKPLAPTAMSALVATPLHATAAISDRKWGTQISLDCEYNGYVPAGPARTADGLTVIAKDGTRYHLGTWTVAAAVDTKFTSGTALPASAIRTIQITSSNGTPVLALNL